MDILIVLLASIFIFLGLIGSFLPVLPGPLTSWVGFLVLHFSDAIPMDWTFLGTTLTIAIVIWIIDYIIPVVGTKRFGGTKSGMLGAVIGIFVAIFFPILGFLGIIVWPFIGALVGELLNNRTNDEAFKAAFGSLIGFLTGTFLKFIVAIIYMFLFIGKVWDYSSEIFTI